MSAEYLDKLADFVTETKLGNLEESTVTAAKNVVLDTIGAILAGSRLSENAGFANLVLGMGNGGNATLFGHAGAVQPMMATLVNATAGVALEMDEGSRLGGGHPSIHVTPGAIAMAEERKCTGAELLESVIVGYEVTSRIGSGTSVKDVVHSHGTWGTAGTAAATARILGFDAQETRAAISMAASMSPANTWTPCLEGATVRNLYPGRSGFQGILAAQLVQCGFTSLRDGPSDLYESLLGGGFNTEAVVAGLGEPGAYRIQNNYFKFHACCLYNHPALDAVESLLRQEEFTATDVSRVQIEAPPLALIMADPEPDNMLAAKFSIPYAVAAMLVRGNANVTAFYPDQVANPQIRELAGVVEVAADSEMSLRRYDYPSARVAVSLKDGRRLEQSVTAQRGDYRNPVTRDELLAKFRFLATETLGESRTSQVIDAVGSLETLGNVRELTGLLRAG